MAGRTSTMKVSGQVLALAVLVGSGIAGFASGFPQQPGGPEVMARGPLHEAFAAPVVFNAAPGVVVPKPPARAGRGAAARSEAARRRRRMDSRLLVLG